MKTLNGGQKLTIPCKSETTVCMMRGCVSKSFGSKVSTTDTRMACV